jgi:1A family penicillin-binding protein
MISTVLRTVRLTLKKWFKVSKKTVLLLRDRFVYAWYAFAVLGVAATLFIGTTALWAMRVDLPSVYNFNDRHVSQSTKIYDRTGKVLLFDVHENIQRTVVPFGEISRHIKNATVAIEDTDFYSHYGIRPTSIIRAIFANITSVGYGQGGSTITQQVIKNTLLTPEKTITRKVKEWVLALALERRLSKDEILSIYLNEMPYGGSIYGVEEACRRFFGKSSRDVTLAEAAYIAALPQAPSYYSPYGNHREDLDRRKNLVLLKMRENNFITEEEYESAKTEVVAFSTYGETNIKAPHFVLMVRDQLEEKYGPEAVYNGGLTVITTINWELQQPAEEIIKKFATKNEEDFNAENAALVALDPKTGQILAMVGSRDYFDKTIDGKFNVATALRQPGSTFKPISYASAFERGYTPETVLFDVPTQFSALCEPTDFGNTENCYSPVNYDGKYRGPMTMRNALAQSVNIPAIKAFYLAGPDNVMRNARNMGLITLTKPAGFYGFSLTLGGGEVSPLQITSAYATFANNGEFNPPVGILEVTDSQGTVLEEYTPNPSHGIDSQAARLLTNVLSDNAARAPSYGVNSFLNFGDIDVAGKTGTTNDYKDVWVVGYTPTIAVGTWAGNNDNSPIVQRVAGYVIAPMWRAYMNEALKVVAHEKFTPPDPIDYNTLPKVLGGDWSNGGMGAHSILYFVNKEDPRTPGTSTNDSQFRNWEYGVQAWATGANLANPENPIGSVVNPILDPATGEQTFTIVNPQAGARISNNAPLTITVALGGAQPLQKVEYYLDGVYIGASLNSPFSMTVIPGNRPTHTIRAVGHISNGGSVIENQVTFIGE